MAENKVENKVEIQVNPSDILAGINGLISAAFDAYESLKQIIGESNIPSWDEISSQNAILQAKIDAEKE